jgi:hypothetical protein
MGRTEENGPSDWSGWHFDFLAAGWEMPLTRVWATRDNRAILS